jgi:hypothetical protein
MTDEELQAIEARVNAATPGPWSTGAGKVEGGQVRELVIAPNDDVIVAIAYGGFGNPVDRTSQDRTFIASARTDVPALVKEVRRLREALVDAWDAGFYASGEGWNGEYPFNHPGRPTREEAKRLRESREESLASLMTTRL